MMRAKRQIAITVDQSKRGVCDPDSARRDEMMITTWTYIGGMRVDRYLSNSIYARRESFLPPVLRTKYLGRHVDILQRKALVISSWPIHQRRRLLLVFDMSIAIDSDLSIDRCISTVDECGEILLHRIASFVALDKFHNTADMAIGSKDNDSALSLVQSHLGVRSSFGIRDAWVRNVVGVDVGIIGLEEGWEVGDLDTGS